MIRRRRWSLRPVCLVALTPLCLPVFQAHAEDASYAMKMTSAGFEPRTLAVKAGQKIRLSVTNAQSASVEFESNALNREKVISAGSQADIYIGPLEPGTYDVFDDFHPSLTATIVAK